MPYNSADWLGDQPFLLVAVDSRETGFFFFFKGESGIRLFVVKSFSIRYGVMVGKEKMSVRRKFSVFTGKLLLQFSSSGVFRG